MTFSLEEKEESTDVFSPKDLSLWKKKSGGRDRKSQRHHIPVCSNWALLQTFFVSDRMESRLSQVFWPRLVLQILSNSVFTLLSLNYQNINIILYLIITNFISWGSRTSFRILRKGEGKLLRCECGPLLDHFFEYSVHYCGPPIQFPK